MTMGGWRYWNLKLEILAALLLVVQFFRSPPLLLVLKYTNFWSPSPLIFSELPFGCLKIFRAPLNIFIPPPLVILNELSPIKCCFTSQKVSLPLMTFSNFCHIFCTGFCCSPLFNRIGNLVLFVLLHNLELGLARRDQKTSVNRPFLSSLVPVFQNESISAV